jgi:hypothetical protein
MIENTIYIIDRCNYTVTDFFENQFPGCKVEDDCVVIMPDGKEYSIMPKQTAGIDVQRDLQFYALELWVRPKEESNNLEHFTACPHCNSSKISDISKDACLENVWECGECGNTWNQKSK